MAKAGSSGSRDRSSSSAKAAVISGLANLGKAIFEPPGQDGHSCQWIALFDQLTRTKLLPGVLNSWKALSTATCTWVSVNGNEHTMLEESMGDGRVDSVRIIDAFGGDSRFHWYRDHWDKLDGDHCTLLACIGMLADVYSCNIAVAVYCCSSGTINKSVVSNRRLSNEQDGRLEIALIRRHYYSVISVVRAPKRRAKESLLLDSILLEEERAHHERELRRLRKGRVSVADDNPAADDIPDADDSDNNEFEPSDDDFADRQMSDDSHGILAEMTPVNRAPKPRSTKSTRN